MWISDQVGPYVVLVHASDVPTESEFQRTLDQLENGASVFMAFAYGNSTLLVQHRTAISSICHERDIQLAAIMEGRLQRGIAMAVGWFVPRLQVFSTSSADLEKAYEFALASAPPEERKMVRATIVTLHQKALVPKPSRLPR